MGTYRKLDENILRKNVCGRLQSQVNENSVGFAEITVLQDGKEVLSAFAGENKKVFPLKHDAPRIYRIASMTKPVTSVAFLQQCEKGKYDLNAPLADYFPKYGSMKLGHYEPGKGIVTDGPAKNQIKLFNLLTHTSGIDNGMIYEIAKINHPRKTLRETVEYFSDIPLAYDPFTTTGYSESGAFDILARLVEIASGENYGDYVKKHIFAPLGMNDTGFEPTEKQKKKFVKMHGKRDGRSVEEKTTDGCVFEDRPYSCTLGGAGLFSTLTDYTAFAEMLRLGGTDKNGSRILGEEWVKTMATPHVPAEIMPGTDRWGLGVRVVCEEGSHLPVGTFGWSGAYGSHFFIDPVDKISAVYMRNSSFDSNGCGSIGFVFEQDIMNSF